MEPPVWGAGVEQRSDPVVAEIPKSEGHSLDALDQVVDRFGWAVRHLGVVPGCDLVGPPLQGLAELMDLRRPLVLKVGRELTDPRQND